MRTKRMEMTGTGDGGRTCKPARQDGDDGGRGCTCNLLQGELEMTGDGGRGRTCKPARQDGDDEDRDAPATCCKAMRKQRKKKERPPLSPPLCVWVSCASKTHAKPRKQ